MIVKANGSFAALLGMDGKVRITASNFSYGFYFLGLYNKQDETNGKCTKKLTMNR